MIDVKLAEDEAWTPRFPRLMRHDVSGIIILATGKDEKNGCYSGFTIHPGQGKESKPVGHYRENWSSAFKDYDGPVTLSNTK